jgi:hypothetical protein
MKMNPVAGTNFGEPSKGIDGAGFRCARNSHNRKDPCFRLLLKDFFKGVL